jgi:hypothetical protein
MAKTKKKREKKTVVEGNVYIQATFNNTIVTITDLKGKRPFLVQRRISRIPRRQEVHPLCGSDNRRDRDDTRQGTTVSRL